LCEPFIGVATKSLFRLLELEITCDGAICRFLIEAAHGLTQLVRRVYGLGTTPQFSREPENERYRADIDMHRVTIAQLGTILLGALAFVPAALAFPWGLAIWNYPEFFLILVAAYSVAALVLVFPVGIVVRWLRATRWWHAVTVGVALAALTFWMLTTIGSSPISIGGEEIVGSNGTLTPIGWLRTVTWSLGFAILHAPAALLFWWISLRDRTIPVGHLQKSR
jgi:hypothetical protein